VYARTSIGCGCIVVNAAGEVLAIRERYDSSGRLHLPGGHLDEAEDWVSAGVREAYEETGVPAEGLGVALIRQFNYPDLIPADAEAGPAEGVRSARSRIMAGDVGATRQYPFADHAAWEHRGRWGTGHTAPYILAYAPTDDLCPDLGEVSEAGWRNVGDFLVAAHPFSAFIIAAASESGMLAAAARLAREHEVTGVRPADCTVPGLLVCKPAVEGGTPRQGAYPSYYYHAFPADVLQRAHTLTAAARGQAEDVPRV
jgi:8-oxo-dGTP pyrophosphatase MutT (NUDIX family)